MTALAARAKTAAGNAGFNLNIPPMPNGRFDDRDVQRLAELGQKIKTEFGLNITAKARITYVAEPDQVRCAYSVSLPEKTPVRYVVLAEDIARGQRVESFLLEKKNETYGWTEIIYMGTTIGNKRVCVLPGDSALKNFTLRITSARGAVDNLKIELY